MLTVTVDDFPNSAAPVIAYTGRRDVAANVTVGHDPLWKDLAHDLRTIEGILSLWGIDEIVIEPDDVEWIAETEEEKRALSMTGFSRSASVPTTAAPPDLLVRSFFAADSLAFLQVPLNFFRRGRLDVQEERFIEAIYDLFFCIEALYGEGKIKSGGLIEALVKADGLVAAINKTLKDPGAELASGRTFTEDLRGRYLLKTPEEIIRTLVDLRGRLHHYSQKRASWNPGDQRPFEVDALVMQWICYHALTDLVLGGLFEPQLVDRVLSAPVETMDGRRIKWNPR